MGPTGLFLVPLLAIGIQCHRGRPQDVPDCRGVSKGLVTHPRASSFAGYCVQQGKNVVFKPKYCAYPRVNISVVENQEVRECAAKGLGFCYYCLYSATQVIQRNDACSIDGKRIEFGKTGDYMGATMLCSLSKGRALLEPISYGQGGSSNCRDGEEKTEKFLVYQCRNGNYEPSNCITERQGKQYKIPLNGGHVDVPSWFRYTCTSDDDGYQTNYKIDISGCLSESGEYVPVGEEKKLRNGKTLSCSRSPSGQINRFETQKDSSSSGSLIRIRGSIAYKVEIRGGRTYYIPYACAPLGYAQSVPIGKTIDLQQVRYRCKQEGQKISFVAEACLNVDCEPVAINEKKRRSDGTYEACYRRGPHKLVYVIFDKAGCRVDRGKVVPPNKEYTENVKLDVNGAKIPYTLHYTCQASHASPDGYVLVPTGCSIAQHGRMRHNDLVIINGNNYVCAIGESGVQHLDIVPVQYFTCTVDGRTYQHLQVFPDIRTSALYRCNMGEVEKIGCHANGQNYRFNSIYYSGNTAYFCTTEGASIPIQKPGCRVGGQTYHFGTVLRQGDSGYICGFVEEQRTRRRIPTLFPYSCFTSRGYIKAFTYAQVEPNVYKYCDYDGQTIFLREKEPNEIARPATDGVYILVRTGQEPTFTTTDCSSWPPRGPFGELVIPGATEEGTEFTREPRIVLIEPTVRIGTDSDGTVYTFPEGRWPIYVVHPNPGATYPGTGGGTYPGTNTGGGTYPGTNTGGGTYPKPGTGTGGTGTGGTYPGRPGTRYTRPPEYTVSDLVLPVDEYEVDVPRGGGSRPGKPGPGKPGPGNGKYPSTPRNSGYGSGRVTENPQDLRNGYPTTRRGRGPGGPGGSDGGSEISVPRRSTRPPRVGEGTDFDLYNPKDKCDKKGNRVCFDMCYRLAPYCLDSIVDDIEYNAAGLGRSQKLRRLINATSAGDVLAGIVDLAESDAGDRREQLKLALMTISRKLGPQNQRCNEAVANCVVKGIQCSSINRLCDSNRNTCPEYDSCRGCAAASPRNEPLKNLVKYLCPTACGEQYLNSPERIIDLLPQLSGLGFVHSVCDV